VFFTSIFSKYWNLGDALEHRTMNFKHLHYFWVAATSGGILRAGEQLHTTPQTLSGQIKLLEERLGRALFKKSGRNLELTEAGRVALGYADQIFTLGAELEGALQRDPGTTRALDFKVGVADSVAKSVAYRLLEPALSLDVPVRLICNDEPMGKKLNVRAFNHPLGKSGMSFFAAPSLKAQLKGAFPRCLHDAPMLIPGAQASVRPQLEAWFTRHQIQPRVVGEFDDGALMSAFGREGRGVFMAPTALEADTQDQYAVELIGRSEELGEEFFAVSVERRITHPCVVAITDTARGQLFGR
jgi:LysR family transcriptional activator of nhaA